MTLEPATSFLNSATPITPEITDTLNGLYTVMYTPSETQIGAYTMTVTIDGAVMLGGPVGVQIASTPHPPRAAPPQAAHLMGTRSCGGGQLLGEDKTNTVLWAVLGSVGGLALIVLASVLVYRRRAKQREYEQIEDLRGSTNSGPTKEQIKATKQIYTVTSE